MNFQYCVWNKKFLCYDVFPIKNFVIEKGQKLYYVSREFEGFGYYACLVTRIDKKSIEIETMCGENITLAFEGKKGKLQVRPFPNFEVKPDLKNPETFIYRPKNYRGQYFENSRFVDLVNVFSSHGAMYCTCGFDRIKRVPVILGDSVLKPGDLVSKLGHKKRTSFEVNEGCYLEYVGKTADGISDVLLFSPYPRNYAYKKVDTYYAFYKVDANTLFVYSGQGGWDVRIENVEILNKGSVCIEGK